MKRTRTALAAPALALVSALTLSACGDSDSSSSSSEDTSASSGTSEESAKSPEKPVDPAAELRRAALTENDVKGFTVKKPDKKYAFAASQDQMKVDKAACAPVAYATNQLPLGTPQADLIRLATGAKGPGDFTYVTLATYGDGEAKTTLADLAEAVRSCGTGFSAKAGRNTGSYSSITAETAPEPNGADESLAFKVTTKYEGMTHTMRAQAARHGDTIALYYAVDGMAFTQARPGNAKIGKAVVDAQSAKLA
ncbi:MULTISPECIES: hypothetical protein [Streptomyces]|uniref:Lipoprotein n=1 Tax=Streptomyces venezuelae TaxID=54571 RepID=A0A5P2B404_STRVZ|nr:MULTISPECIES: hypothetical protein [Streptomyces]NEA03319.1 hypothetical protein [Streptomyces sp. SID10116]MYY80260.1 hypothetical protein [Streptomyces sp. SID335]MYZ17385.1 hypothetical protein [Streptomyces sp. SID337]NDZ91964.1 hypothetical protein [Streptomyces sp. SID10115]NEB49930.1 hypothetical protein [Streptomyces sp. SID339]